MEEQLLKAIMELGKQMNDMDIKISAKIDSIDDKLGSYKAQLDELKISHDKQEERLDYIEKEIRMRNLVFFGIPDQERTYIDLENIILKTINEDLQIECLSSEIQHVKRIGQKSERPRPINVGLTTYGKKILIMKNKNKLADTNIYIKEDFPPKVLKERKLLQEQLKMEITGGKKAFIKYNKLVVLPEASAHPNEARKTAAHNTTYLNNKKRALPKESSPNTNKGEYSRAPKKNKPLVENRNITQYLSFQNKNTTPKTNQDNSTREIL